MSKNTDRELGHGAEADGIEEYDNPLPDWWVGLFFVTILWGVIYGINWHFVAQTSQAKLYEQELADAKVQWPDLERKAAFDDAPETLALGAETFTSTCVACHGADMRGGIGPNLVDSEWIHGGSFEAISTTITEGVAAKGMPTWGPILGPKKVAALASYILSKNTGEAPAPAADAAVASADGGVPGGTPADAPTDDGAAAAGGDDVGQQVFTTNCVACHNADMTGGVGPNLVDAEWIHGGDLASITATITNGVPAKGMVTWKGILTDAQIDAVARYVYGKSHPDAAE